MSALGVLSIRALGGSAYATENRKEGSFDEWVNCPVRVPIWVFLVPPWFRGRLTEGKKGRLEILALEERYGLLDLIRTEGHSLSGRNI